MRKSSYWSPYIAGIGLGLTLLVTFFVMGRGLGASSAFSIGTAVAVDKINPDFARGLTYFSNYLAVESPLRNWIVFEVAGLFFGALVGAAVSALVNRNFKFRIDKGAGISVSTRFLTALGGGVLIGIASRLARGCTSGVALTGGAQLAVSGWIFVMAMFLSGFIVTAFSRRLWS